MQIKPLHILIVSYFFKPDKVVGALRTSYWAINLPTVLPAKVSVITANPDASGEGVIVVPHQSKKAGGIIKDAGGSWKNDALDYLNSHSIENPDVVIISGSPFMHFSLAAFFKKQFRSKIILDYRDPFARNPAFKNHPIKVLIKRFFEKKFNNQADALVTVNDYCAGLIDGFHSKLHAVVQNGFDETVVPNLKAVDHKNPCLVYTGKFYFDPSNLFQALDQLGFSMEYAGPDSHLLSGQMSVLDRGFVSYEESVQMIASSDIAVIQTYGEDFQSTTKLFDYIRCGRIILIISAKHLRRGSLHEELKDYPNVFWSSDSPSEISAALDEITKTPYIEVDDAIKMRFSRRVQMLKLVDLISKLHADA